MRPPKTTGVVHQGRRYKRGLWQSPSGVTHGVVEAWPETACGIPVQEVGSGWKLLRGGDATCKRCERIWRMPMPR